MARTTGLGIKGKTTIGGVLHSPPGKAAGGNFAPSGRAAFYPGGAAPSPKASSAASIRVVTPKASAKPAGALKTPPTK